jgi:arginase
VRGQPLALIGVPTSAGAFAPGQERAPEALRDAGLLELLRDAGIDVRDRGDRRVWRWRPDRENPRAQNLGAVVEIVQDTARRVAAAVAEGEATLVLGGDCTVGIGTVAGHVESGGSTGLFYFDAHADLNTPTSVHEGALDWMGMAHMLGEEGAAPELVEVGATVPLLDAAQVVVFGWGAEQATEHERKAVERLSLEVVPADEVRADPAATASRALDLLEEGANRFVVHFDVDVIDFTDAPLSENPGRNEGLAYDHAVRALEVVLQSPRLAGLTLTELNPDHAAAAAGSVDRLTADLARLLRQ